MSGLTGLTGSHRVGKTSLARTYADKNKLQLIETSASAVFRELGLDPSVTYPFDTRLTVQEAILDKFDQTYSRHAADDSITDRTPLDMMAYTLAEAVGDNVSSADQKRLFAYIERCFEVTNRRFTTLIVVQPGIKLIAEEGKAALNDAYIEHLNTMIMGLSVDERSKVPHFYIPRSMINMNDRVAAVEFAVGRVVARAQEERKGASFLH